MLFHSLQFLAFFAVVFFGYWLVARWRVPRLLVLLGASVAFYAAWNPWPLLLFAAYAVINLVTSRTLERVTRPAARKAVLATAVTLQLGCLCLFKYGNLFLGTSGWLLRRLGLQVQAPVLDLVLPLGLSFVTFQAISYLVDVYRGQVSGRHGMLAQLTYLLFFPTVVSGPIVRAKDLLERFDQPPSLDPLDGAQGLFRMAMGIAKKLLLADVLAAGLVNPVFADPTLYTSAECAIAAVAYSLQLYFDFSAYSDVAIGAARMFGFQLPENFDKPYHARNLFEFWNRWHISLSSWLRDYFYIPLGGSRGSRLQTLRNLFLVMTLGGLWHGAGWRFALWGGIHGGLLVLLRTWWWIRGRPKSYGLFGTTFGVATTFSLVVLTRIFFRANDVPQAVTYFHRLLEFTPGLANVSPLLWATLIGTGLAYLTPRSLFDRGAELFAHAPIPARAVALVGLGLLLRQVAGIEVQPYIYFQF
ncbi:MAG: MBOAT family protein [Myxococcota bacterium]|nr:MBOAT family protein [Myxococcota bacterium]